MQYWNISDTETPALKLLGFCGVTVSVGGVTLRPGESADIPMHFRAEAAPWVNRGVLAMQAPKPRHTVTVEPMPEPAPEPVRVESTEPAAIESEATAEVQASTRGGRRRDR